MKTYTIAIDVKKVYHVKLQAISLTDAMTIANNMQSTEIAERGELIDVETEAIQAEQIDKGD
jgi:hypothetical protein